MASHIEEQQEIDNFKYFWSKVGKWLFIALVLAALGYLGKVLYDNHLKSQNQEAAAELAKMVEKAQANNADTKQLNADLQNLQQNYGKTIAAGQATLMTAATEFDAGRYDVAAGHLKWVLDNQKDPLMQALAAQRLATVKLQQKKYDEALAALNTAVEPDFEPLLLETKGDVLVAQNKPKEALAAYQQAAAKLAKGAPSGELLQIKINQLK